MSFHEFVPPKIVSACRRTGMRHRLRHAHQAFLVLTVEDGRSWQLDLLDIGSGGVCFGLIDGQPAMERGMEFGRVVLHVAGSAIRGSLEIAHATEEFAAGTVCGARFHPATREDQIALEALIRSLAS
ncbi:MAG TPA: hypothetical protein VFV19_16985 [Candidatus Polarisedimenticolaceae bacterium]|nr:hypothetical protein [Candidatus Polarisedimenticolaceae bacterium]